MTAPEALTDPELEQVSWDLSDLLAGAPAADPQAAVDALLDDAQRRADAFSATYAGKVAELDGPGLVAAMHALAELEEIAAQAGTYAHLSFSVNTADPARGALLQRVEERGTAIETALLFFQLEWAALDDAKAQELLAADGLDFARHHLRTARRYRPHLLSEPEEKILSEKASCAATPPSA
jgi:oligoendopeptidase F